MRICVSVLFALILGSSFRIVHPLKMSYTIISYSEKDKTLNIENRFFADDFQRCINQEYNQRYDLKRFYNTHEIRAVVDNFTNTYLKIKLNEKILTFNCSNSDYVEDANLFYFRYKLTNIVLKKDNNLVVENRILLNYFKDQKNGLVLNLSKSTVEKTVEFDSEHIYEAIKFTKHE